MSHSALQQKNSPSSASVVKFDAVIFKTFNAEADIIFPTSIKIGLPLVMLEGDSTFSLWFLLLLSQLPPKVLNIPVCLFNSYLNKFYVKTFQKSA
jgi:hypothetical protein